MTHQHASVGNGQGSAMPALGGVAAALARVRAKARLRLCVLGLAWLIAAALAVAGVVVAFDYVTRLPAVLRGVLLVVGLIAIAWGFRRAVLPALRFRPGLTEVALRLEQSEAGRKAGLAGVLASGLELSGAGSSGAGNADAATALESSLSARVAREAMSRFSPSIAASVFVPTRVRRAVLMMVMLVAALGLWGAMKPELARIGAMRLVAPWAGVEWPKRTSVADATGTKAHAVDTALPLRAILSKTDRAPGRTDVWVNYRLIQNGEAAPVQKMLMTAQQKRAASVIATASELTGQPIAVVGEMYERLVEPAGLLAGRGSADAGAGQDVPQLEYWFQTSDDRTEPERVALVERPVIVSGKAEVLPPGYAAKVAAAGWWAGTQAVTMTDAGANLGPILAGSAVRLRLELNKPVPAAPTWVAESANEEGTTTIEGQGASWTLAWTATEARRMSVSLRDEYDLRSADDAVFNVDVLTDQNPGATVVDPARDESVLATAVLDVVGEGRDDIGLAWVAAEYERVQGAPSPAPPDSAGAPPTVELARQVVDATATGEPVDQARQVREVRVTATLDLSELGVKPGDEVRVTTLAKDIFKEAGSAGEREHDAVRSSPRRFRIITEGELVEQLQSELAGVRQSAIRLDREQSQVSEQMARLGPEGAASSDLRRRQWSVGESLRPQSQALERLGARAERNGLRDRNLDLMLESAQAIVARAGESSAKASAAMEKAGAQPSEAAQAAAEAASAQQGVRDELSRLIELLESGKDGWAVRRAIEKLLSEQKELSARNDQLGAQTVGRAASDLTAGQRDELNRLAQQQREAAAKAGAALDQMLSRAKQMSESDPAQAESMMQAARRAQERGLREAMEQAADEIAKNKTQSGSDYQDRAEEALSQMLEEMENTEAKREEVLRRVLAGLIKSIEQLVKHQEGDIEALGRADKVGIDTLGKSMINLRSRTLAVGDEAKGAGRDAVKVIEQLDAAGEAQASAITALRGQPADTGAADAMERTSLDRLNEALAEAKRLEEQSDQRDQDRKRSELRQHYREALLAQQDLRTKTAEYAGKALSRRDRAVLRGLGERQEAQRKTLDTIRQQTEELQEAKVFQFAHQRLNDILARVAATLNSGEATARTVTEQLAAEKMLESLIESLKDDGQEQDFREGSDGGAGGGGGGGGDQRPAIPPMAELRLLRMIQQEIADRTREASGQGAAGDVVEQLGSDQNELAKHAQELIERMKKQSGAGPGAAQ